MQQEEPDLTGTHERTHSHRVESVDCLEVELPSIRG